MTPGTRVVIVAAYSAHNGRVGTVVRVVRNGDTEWHRVALDGDRPGLHRLCHIDIIEEVRP